MDYQSIILLIIGFSLIILIHEAGHFLAAKYVGIRVEQFALGFGQAIFSWRKGLGFRAGSSEKEYQKRQKEGTAEGIGETEYRWNWIPLGGYVKMMGQDDTKPGLVVNDPRSYTSKTVGQRMLVISAGVIMNILFAGIAFMVLFIVGLNVPQARVGGVTPMAPAQLAIRADGTPAPLQVGDEIIAINGTPQHNDFRKIALNTALAKKGEPLAIEVKRVNGVVETVYATPQASGGSMKLLMLGVEMPPLLQGPDLSSRTLEEEWQTIPVEKRKLNPGDEVVAVAGQTVDKTQYYLFDQALQASNGNPIDLTVRSADGKQRQTQVRPVFEVPFGESGLHFAGMVPRMKVAGLTMPTSVEGKVIPGDVVTSVRIAGDVKNDPSPREFSVFTRKAGKQGEKISVTILRDGNSVTLNDLVATVRLDTSGTKGLGIAPGYERDLPIVAETLKESPAAAIPAGSQIKAINSVAIGSWDDVLRELRKVQAGETAEVSAVVPGAGTPTVYPVKLASADVQFLANMRYGTDVPMKIATGQRTTKNPLEAAWWGVQETRDSILQVYLTISRLAEGSVPVSGVMGPVGMFQVGTKVASQGVDYLLWFLAIISANLAVVNFLPIPVVDGGHFLFLTIEKLRGRPVSERTMAIAQWCGLALIGFVFLFVTYQDILRNFTVQ